MPVFDTIAATLIHSWNQAAAEPVQIQCTQTGHDEDPRFLTIAQALESEASMITIRTSQQDKGLPGFKLKENIMFSAFPLERELEPFLEALSHINVRRLPLPDDIQYELDTIDIPVHLKLYIALACPHCPAMVRSVMPLAMYCPNIYLEIIDGSLFSDAAGQDQVLSAPCLILDGDFRWTRQADIGEITRMIARRDPTQLGTETLLTILEQGKAQWLSDQMIDQKQIFKNFLTLLLHDTWAVRLGAMVVLEDLCAKDPSLAATICPDLIDRFEKETDITVQGDILYALGEAGTRQTLQWLSQKIASLENQDLIDAAQDALDSLSAKPRSSTEE